LTIFVCGSVSLNLETSGNHWVLEHENVVGGAFPQIRIQVQHPVEQVTYEQVGCKVKVRLTLGQLSSALLFTCDKQFTK